MTVQPHDAYAGLISRVAALVIDGGLLVVATLGVGTLPGLTWEQLVNRPAPGWLTISSMIVASLLPWAYFTSLWWLGGQTAGDLIMGLTVKRGSGARVSLPQAAVRAAGGLLLAPLWLIGLIVVLWDERRRALHDLVFHTVVPYVADPRRSRPVSS